MNENSIVRRNGRLFCSCSLPDRLISSTFAHVSNRQRFHDGNNGNNAGQNYAAAIISIAMSAHGYDKGFPDDKKHARSFYQGYSLGYKKK